MKEATPGQSKMASVTTTNLGPEHHEKIGVGTTTGPMNYNKLNMNGGSNVRVVSKEK